MRMICQVFLCISLNAHCLAQLICMLFVLGSIKGCGRLSVQGIYFVNIILILTVFNFSELVELIIDIGLAKTVLNVHSYVLRVVLEFYANLHSKSVSCLCMQNFRLWCLCCFSPDSINAFLGFVLCPGLSVSGVMHLVVSEITGGLMITWPGSNGIRASSLSHKLPCGTGVPTTIVPLCAKLLLSCCIR